MEFESLIRERYSVRAYKDTPVEDEKLQAVLEAANIAPTAANRQPFRIIVLRTEGRREELQRMYHRSWFVDAPIIIAVVAVQDEGWTRSDGVNYADVDATIAMDHLILAAANLGLGTCWIANFDPAATHEVLQLPKGVETIAMTPLGYPADSLKSKKRKEIQTLVLYDVWSE